MTDIARRVGVLQEAGHGWLEPDSQLALAAAPTSDQSMVAQAASFRQALNQNAAQSGTSLLGSVGAFFGDPVLQKKPSAALALRSYLLQKQGWSPIAEEDLRSIQQKLVDAGYLDQSEVNGVYTPATAAAYYKATSDHVEQQQTHSGGFSIGHALAAFLPTHWIPALVGAAKALPGELRDLVSEAAGGVSFIAHGPFQSMHSAQQNTQAPALAVENALGNNLTPQQEDAQQGRHVINAVNALLTAMPVARAGKAAAMSFDAARAAAANTAVNDAAGTGFLRGMLTDLGPEAAQRGPGVISKALYSTGDSGAANGILRNRLFEQSPVARFIAPPIRTIFAPDGKTLTHAYYLARTGLAQPTRLAGVQALRAAAGQAQTAGISQEAIAAIEGKLGAHHTALADQIHSAGTIGGPFGVALDLLSGTFGGPIHTAATLKAAQEGRQVLIGINPSHTVSALVQGFTDATTAALKPLNVGWHIDRGLSLSDTSGAGSKLAAGVKGFVTGRGGHLEDMIGKYGLPFVTAYWNDKINKYAVVHYAEQALSDSGLAKDSQSYLDRYRELSHEVLHDPELLKTQRDELLGSMNELTWRIGQDGNRISREMESQFRQGMDSYHEAWAPMTQLVTRHVKELLTPQALETLGKAQQEHKFLSALGQAEGATPVADSAFLDANHPGAVAGSLGLARKALAGQPPEVETQTQRLMLDTARKLQTRLDAAGSPVVDAEDIGKPNLPAYNPDQIHAVRRDAINYLFTYKGLNHFELDGLSAQQLIDAVKEAAGKAPKDVALALDASPEARALVGKIEAAGYKLVAGTDVGHVFTPPVIDPVLIEGYHSRLRSVANLMGLNTVPVAVKDAAMIRAVVIERTLQKAINDGVIRVPPSFNGARLHMWLLENLESRASLSTGESMAFAAGKPLHVRAAKRLLGEDASPQDIEEQLQRQRLLIARGTQPLEVRPSEFVGALTRELPESVKTALDLPAGDAAKFMDAKSAQKVYDLYVHALVHEPAWVFGAGKLEDLYRASFGFLGTKASELPVLHRLSRLPNATIRVRNRYRFQLDPMFSMKRTAKTALKAAIPGDHGIASPLTVTPFAYMARNGILDDAYKTLDRVLPMKGAEGWDTNDRLLYENDAFGLYNPRHHMALRAHELDKAGLTDKHIAADLKRTFTYGDRTAFERSIGTIWYPFSFEKTLWRNVGSYMLDRPGSRLMATVAFDAYNALAQHDGIDEWLKDHAPLLREFQKMNAFEHGIGPGQVGGINAMYAPALWNLFGPQKYGAKVSPRADALFNIFPAMRELNSLLVGYSPTSGTFNEGTLTSQAGIGLWATQHVLDRATVAIGLGHAADSPFNLIGKVVPLRDETKSAEQNKAWAYRNSLVMALAPVLDYNYHHRNSEKVWGDSAPANVRGKVINRSSIDEIVHSVYKSYDPSVAQSLAVTKQTEMQRYLDDLALSDPQRAAAYQQFVVPAEKLRPILQRAVTDPAKYQALARVEGDFRNYAVNLSEQDPRFLDFWNRFYLSTFGPIQAVL